MKQRKSVNSRYITGFDGIRAIAVIGVILYHMLPDFMEGGYLGVPIFFVLSGYLITDLLWQEWENTGRINLKSFYERRAKRLIPVLLGMFIVCTSYITLFQPELLNNIRGAIFSGLTYTNNWWQIAEGSNYFASFGSKSPFVHIWSLAVEGQYYLVWPIIFIIMVKYIKKREHSLLGIIGISLVSALSLALLFKQGPELIRAYYGTDTRLFSILIGTGLAYALPSYKKQRELTDKEKKILNTVGIVAMAGILIFFVTLSDLSYIAYWGGMYLVSILAAVLVAMCVISGTNFNKYFTNKVFAYLGKRSYGIYLWQSPILVFFDAKVKLEAEMSFVYIMYIILQLAVILLVSEISYRLIEVPFQKYHYMEMIAWFKRHIKAPYPSKKRAGSLVAIIIMMIAVVGMVIAPSDKLAFAESELASKLEANEKLLQKQQEKQEKLAEVKNEEGKAHSQNHKDKKDKTSKGILKGTKLQKELSLTSIEIKKANDMKMTVVGDSVMLDVGPELHKIFPKAIVDAKISRQMYHSYDLLKSLKKKGKLHKTVIIALGTNGEFSQKQFDEFMAILGKERQVYWVNVWEPNGKHIERQVNALLKENEGKMKNLKVVDWHNLAKGKKDWFYKDKTHPNDKGTKEYAKLLGASILK